MKTYRCREAGCEFVLEAQSPGAMNGHYRSAHPDRERSPQSRVATARRRASNRVEEPEVEPGETEVLVACVGWFEAVALDGAAAQRVCDYLAARFGLAAVVDDPPDPVEA
jgi:hypothetical protein